MKDKYYAIAHEWDDGSLGFYSYDGEIFEGNRKEAEKFLQYVKKNDPYVDWFIVRIKLEKLE